MSGFHPSLSYPASNATFGETDTFVSSETEDDNRYEQAEIVLDPMNVEENREIQFDLPVSSRNPHSSLPKNRAQFILNLDQTEIDNILDPINRQILSADTVFSLHDARSGISLAISGQEILEILKNNDRAVNQESPYENENVDYSLVEKRSGRCRLTLSCLVTSFIAIVIAVIVTVIILKPWKEPPSVFPIVNGSLPVIIIFGGTIMQGYGFARKYLPLDKIELYYPDNTDKNRLLDISMLTPRYGHVSGRLEDNVVIAGGSTSMVISSHSSLSSVEIFNLVNGSVTIGPSMLYSRTMAAGETYRNAFFVCGGVYSLKQFLDPAKGYGYTDMQRMKQCEVLYNIHSSWQLLTPMNNYRPMFNSIVTIENFVYILGQTVIKSNQSDNIGFDLSNFSLEKYGPLELNGFNENLSWTPATDILHSTYQPDYDMMFSVSTPFCNNTSIITCILEALNDDPYAKNKCMLYSEKNKWVQINSLDQANGGGYIFVPVNTATCGCAIYAMGGLYMDFNSMGASTLDKVMIFTSSKNCVDVSELCWIPGPELKQSKMFVSAVVISQ